MKHQFQIIITSKNKQKEFIGSYPTRESALRAFHKLKVENEQIVFPKRHINSKTIERADYEIVLIKRRNYDEDKVTQVRNDNGAFKEHMTNNDNWIVFDKAPYNVEEEFWVYGHHPLRDRKNIMFIYENMVKPKIYSKMDFLNIQLYKNKLLLETFNSLDMIICKNKSDCIQLYNKLQEMCEKDRKAKYYLFSGDGGITKAKAAVMIQKIQNLTHWDKTKIKRSKTSERK